MNNQEKKLFNIACKIEKLLYEHCSIVFFNKEVYWNKAIINSGRKELGWDFLESFIDLMKKDEINFSILKVEDNTCLQIKIEL
jgi:hypothetical protein